MKTALFRGSLREAETGYKRAMDLLHNQAAQAVRDEEEGTVAKVVMRHQVEKVTCPVLQRHRLAGIPLIFGKPGANPGPLEFARRIAE